MQEAQWPSKGINQNKSIPGYIIPRFLKSKYKEKSLEQSERNNESLSGEQ